MSATVWACALHSLKRIRPIHGSNGRESKRGHHRVDGIAELFPRDDVCAWRVGDFAERLAQQANRILHSGKKVRSDR